MPKYAAQVQSSSHFKFKDLTSLQELPRIFVNVTKAIGMFVDIWLGTNDSIETHFPPHPSAIDLGREIDPSCLYSPKPSSNSIAPTNDNTPSTPTNNLTARPAAQSLRGVPSILQQPPILPPMPGTLKTTRSQLDNRKSTSPGPTRTQARIFSFFFFSSYSVLRSNALANDAAHHLVCSFRKISPEVLSTQPAHCK